MYQSSLFNAGLKNAFSENKKKKHFSVFQPVYVRTSACAYLDATFLIFVDHMQRIQSLENLHTNI